MNTKQIESSTNVNINFDFKALSSYLCKKLGLNINTKEAEEIINICRQLRIPNEIIHAEALIDDLIYHEYAKNLCEIKFHKVLN